MSRKKKPNIGSPSASQSAKPQRRWYKVDLHLHTPASHDYEEPGVSYLDWLRKVVEQGLEIVAITDHNTVAGISAIRKELDWLTQLEVQGRLTAQERERLQAWREAGNQVLVLPGFEFTATFGFHILAIFPPETSVRELEHILLSMKVPASKLDIGSTETGATTDVLTAYRIIHEAGGLVIAAHANSTHGVAMRNFPFGGQTKIAYTQDLNLDALEVTDLDRPGRSTARFFNGSKSEYPRRMHCLQGSDAHRLTMDPRNPKRLGIGDRATELLLDEPTFDAIAALLRSKQFDRVR
ncbi:MAG: PHP domain-containing protein, partial [Caldilinea sp.]